MHCPAVWSPAVVHADIKSANILLTAAGSAKLSDCGLACIQSATFLSALDQVMGTWAW